VPMLPVVASPPEVARKIVSYSWAMAATSIALTWWAGWIYGAIAVVLGAWFVGSAHMLRTRIAVGAAPQSMRLFHRSIAYLTLLFAAVAVTAVLPFGQF